MGIYFLVFTWMVKTGIEWHVPVLVIMSLIVWLEAITFIILHVLHSLQVMREDTNKHDESAVGITKGVCIIGHIPREI